MKAFLFTLLTVPAFLLAGEETTVTCTGKIQNKKETVQLRLDSNGEIIQWDKETWGRGKGDYLGVYSQIIEEYGFEWHRSFSAPNGYSILELGTTADAHIVGVNLKRGRGFYTYKDHGSGAGHLGPVPLTCKEN